MISEIKTVFLLLILILSCSNAYGQEKDFDLQNGSKLILNPSGNKEFVKVVMFLEKDPDNWSNRKNIRSELYFEELKKELGRLGISVYASPNRMLPENRYNWFEHQYLVLSLTKSQFSSTSDQIITLIQKLPEFKNHQIDRLLLSYSDVFDDSVLYTSEQLRQIHDAVTNLQYNSETRGIVDAEPDSIAPSVWIYVYGGFNPLKIVHQLTKPQEVKGQSKPLNESKNTGTGLTVSLNQISNQTLLRMAFRGAERELHPVLLFITSFLKQNFCHMSGIKRVRIYYPWKKDDPELIICLNHLDSIPDSSKILSLFSELINVEKKEFSRWYYSDYVNYINSIKSEPEKNIFTRLIYKSEGWDPDKFESVYLNPDEVFNFFKSVVSGIKVVQN